MNSLQAHTSLSGCRVTKPTRLSYIPPGTETTTQTCVLKAGKMESGICLPRGPLELTQKHLLPTCQWQHLERTTSYKHSPVPAPFASPPTVQEDQDTHSRCAVGKPSFQGEESALEEGRRGEEGDRMQITP